MITTTDTTTSTYIYKKRNKSPDVVGQMFLSGVCLGAEGTLVGGLASMLMHVVGQVLLAGKLLRAIRALEWSLARM